MARSRRRRRPRRRPPAGTIVLNVRTKRRKGGVPPLPAYVTASYVPSRRRSVRAVATAISPPRRKMHHRKTRSGFKVLVPVQRRPKRLPRPEVRAVSRAWMPGRKEPVGNGRMRSITSSRRDLQIAATHTPDRARVCKRRADRRAVLMALLGKGFRTGNKYEWTKDSRKRC